jgi:RND family efflux transporter MFP subunit
MKLSLRIIPALFFLTIVIALALFLTRPEAPAAIDKEKVRTIEYLSIKAGTYSASIPLFVQVTTPHHAHIKSAITADVAQLHQFVGQAVTKGALLIQLDDREAKLVTEQRLADLQDIQAQIENENLQHENELYVIGNEQDKRAKHNRAQIIKGHKIRLASLNARRQHANALLKLARLDLNRAKIVAPFSGRITALHVSTGDRVRTGDALIDIYDDQAIEFSGPVPARYVGMLQAALDKGDRLKAKATIDNQATLAYLDRLSGQVSEHTGAIEAIFKIPSPSSNLALGQQLELSLNLPSTEEAFVIPTTSLYGTKRIYKVVDNRLVTANVQILGDYISDNAEQQLVATSGDIIDGDLIMTTQLPDAIENLLVKLSPTHDD